MIGDNRFVFVAPMFNASKYVGQMLSSIVSQSYDNWKIVLIDDMSDSDEWKKELAIINQWLSVSKFQSEQKNVSSLDDKISVVCNVKKKWEVENVLYGINHFCEDDDIVCRIDADDWLTDIDSLNILNFYYKNYNIDALWTAHRWGYSNKNISGPLPQGCDVYKHPWVSSHLKTFRKRLINNVLDENFRGPDGNYIRRAGDQAIYLPVLHNAKYYGFLDKVMYHYTIDDVPETYQTQDAHFQRDEAIFLRERGYVK